MNFDALWDYRNPQGTEEKFLECIAELSIHEDNTLLPQLYTQLARCRSLQKDEQGCLEYLQKAFDITETLDLVQARLPLIRYYLERGRLLNILLLEDRGKADFLNAWKLSREFGFDFYAVDAAHMLGIICPPDEALEWNTIAMDFAEQSDDMRAKSWLGALYNNIGWTYHARNEFSAALHCFMKDETWYRERGRKEEALIAKWSAAKMLRLLNRVDEALAELYLIADERKALSLANDGYLSEEIGECLLAKGKIDESTPFFSSAYEILSEDPWMIQSQTSRLERLKMLGKI